MPTCHRCNRCSATAELRRTTKGYVCRDRFPCDERRKTNRRNAPKLVVKLDDGYMLVMPSAVWLDALDPYASGMEGELELGTATRRPRGKGSQRFYRGLTAAQVEETCRYVYDRADTLLGQYLDDDERNTLYTSRRWARRALAELERQEGVARSDALMGAIVRNLPK